MAEPTFSHFWAVFIRRDSQPDNIAGVSGIFNSEEDARLLAAATCLVPGYNVQVETTLIRNAPDGSRLSREAAFEQAEEIFNPPKQETDLF